MRKSLLFYFVSGDSPFFFNKALAANPGNINPAIDRAISILNDG
jgi:hypothetical protein